MKRDKLKKLVFPKGVRTIIFPVYIPLGDFMFLETSRFNIDKIKNKYLPRKNVVWDFKATYIGDYYEVTVSKN